MIIEINDNGRNGLKITEIVRKAAGFEVECTKQEGIEPMFVYVVNTSLEDYETIILGRLVRLLGEHYPFVNMDMSGIAGLYNITLEKV